jgi:hypothetical protein
VLVTYIAVLFQHQIALAVYEQKNGLLAFMSGSFNATQQRWSVIEKEAFPIIKS